MKLASYKLVFLGALSCSALPANAAFTINVSAGAALAGNAPALAAFNRATAQWTSRLADNITVNIDANIGALGAGIIGSTGSVELQAGYTTVRNAMVSDEAAESNAAAIVAFLPTAAQFTATVPSSFTLSSNMLLTKANAKALGFTGLDGMFGASDAAMTFNSGFSFDFDNSNGVSAGTLDFETVVAHEIGHALGFISAVDDVDGSSPFAIMPTTLDMYRFNTASLPTSNATFTTNARNLVPGANDFFNDTTNSWRMSTGSTQGDGNQASHWKADEITGSYLGIMDPTLANGAIENITSADTRAFDLIGYDLTPVPEPMSLTALGLGVLAIVRRRKRQ